MGSASGQKGWTWWNGPWATTDITGVEGQEEGEAGEGLNSLFL